MTHFTAIILAGTIRPSPLRQVLDIPVLCLPVGREDLLLNAWRSVLADVGISDDLRVVVNSYVDIETVASAAGRKGQRGNRTAPRIIAEPTAWRGTAGVLRDVTDDLQPADVVVVAEASCLPPVSLRPLIEAMSDDAFGVVGVGDDQVPAGVYLFTRQALERVAAIGYQDVKEQMLPALHQADLPVRCARLGDEVHRIRDRSSYLQAVSYSLEHANPGRPPQLVAPQASVSGSALLEGFCLVEPGAIIEDGAVVHDSIVLAGATVGGGAVVTRSVLGPRVTVVARARIVQDVVVEGVPSTARGQAVGTRGGVTAT